MYPYHSDLLLYLQSSLFISLICWFSLCSQMQGYPYVGLVALTFLTEPAVDFSITPDGILGGAVSVARQHLHGPIRPQGLLPKVFNIFPYAIVWIVADMQLRFPHNETQCFHLAPFLISVGSVRMLFGFLKKRGLQHLPTIITYFILF